VGEVRACYLTRPCTAETVRWHVLPRGGMKWLMPHCFSSHRAGSACPERGDGPCFEVRPWRRSSRPRGIGKPCALRLNEVEASKSGPALEAPCRRLRMASSFEFPRVCLRGGQNACLASSR